MFFAKNIKCLRKRLNKTQDDLAFSLGMKRSTLSGYENEIAEPCINSLIQFSEYFKISIDTLVKTDLTLLTEHQLYMVINGIDIYTKGEQLRVLTTTLDTDGNENIELIPIKAHAGYTQGYADLEYLKELQRFNLPFLNKNAKYRCFQIQGDSMLPIKEKTWIIAEYVQNWNDIKNNQACIILTLNDGIVFKVIQNNLQINQTIELHSLNPAYKPYTVHYSDIKEIWRFVCYITTDFPEKQPDINQIYNALTNIHEEISRLKK